MDCRWRLLLAGIGLVGLSACRPAEPARFTPSAEVAALTDDLEDDEEKAQYRKLQGQISDILRARFGEPGAPKLVGVDDTTAEHAQRGAELYAQYCVQCHGVNGDGRGAVAGHLSPLPRDYTMGIFKFTSTSNGKPRRADLIATVRRGVRGTSMPSFATLPHDELGAVVDYVLTLTHRGEVQRQLAQRAFDDGELPGDEDLDAMIAETLAPWKEANSAVVLPVTTMPLIDAESIAQGRELYLKFACSRCHGNDLRGGSFGKVDVGVDVWGHKAAAADLTSGMFRGGSRPIDVYRRIYAGIPGSPMPGFATQFANEPDVIWRLVHYVADAGQQRRRNIAPSAGAAAPSESSGEAPVAAADASAEEASAESTPAEASSAESAPVAASESSAEAPADAAAGEEDGVDAENSDAEAPADAEGEESQESPEEEPAGVGAN